MQDDELTNSNDSVSPTDDSQTVLETAPEQQPVNVEPTPADSIEEVAEEELEDISTEETQADGMEAPTEEAPSESEEIAEEVAEQTEEESIPAIASEQDEPKAEEEEITFSPIVDATQASSKWPGKWYVLHTYSGYEDAVSDALKQRIESLDMQDKIFDVMVPKENQIEIKGGKRKIVEKKMFPGYVLVNMNVTHDSWFVVRNTPNVTGFIGTDTDPVPVEESEIKAILKRMSIEEPKYNIDLSVGDLVHIKDGPFKNYDGSVSEVDEERGKIKVLVSIFGRETPVELDFLQVTKV